MDETNPAKIHSGAFMCQTPKLARRTQRKYDEEKEKKKQNDGGQVAEIVHVCVCVCFPT